MTPTDEIIRMASQSGIVIERNEVYYATTEGLATFAALVSARAAAIERAKVDALVDALTVARNRLSDLLMNGGDDGQAWKEARKSMPLIEAALATAQGDGT